MDGRTSATGDGLTTSVHVVELVGNFVRLADTLSDDFEIDRHLEVLVRACMKSLPVAGAAVVMVDAIGGPIVAAASDDDVHALERLQLFLDHGPALDCLRDGGAPVAVRLAEQAERWPVYVQEARAAGFESALVIPMRQSQQMLGALALYDHAPHPLPREHLQVAEGLARVATIGLLQHRSRTGSQRRADQLQQALNTRVVIEQAKGALAQHGQISAEDSFERLRAHARSSRQSLYDVAAAVVDRRLAADDVLTTPRPPQ